MPADAPVPPGGFRFRLIFAALGAIGMAIVYGLKVNLSVTIVAMINHTSLDAASLLESGGHHVSITTDDGELASDQCFDPYAEKDPSAASEDGPFEWTEPEQGLVLGSYFWGYLITQIPGGRVAELFGGKWVFLVAVLMNIVGAVLSPLCARAGYEYVIIMRIIQGLGGGVTFPAMNVLVAKWAPAPERSTMASIVYGGTALGTVISIPTAGLIAGSLGWDWVFYLHGGLAGIWCVLWVIFVTDTPETNKFLSQAEKEYILISTGGNIKKKTPPVPWKSILTSPAVWAIIFSHTLNNFGWYMLLVELPLFMRTGLGFNITENAGLSALPFLCNWLFSIVYSNRLDWAREKGWISTTMARKVSMAIASVIPACCLVGVCFAGCDKTAVVLLMIVGTGFFGAMFAGVFSNHVDIASNYAGVLMGISNMAATIPGFAVPAFVGVLTHGQTGTGPWHIVFYATAGLLGLEFVLYSLLASGEEQPWNKGNEVEDTEANKSSENQHLAKPEE
eukprot:maker-scaffold88_size394946-snap-gene-2.23 protein:Tk05794 transcript:maker-scaffold88_size394946-snap-gene-2.23-mRNA-1 annotation:"hypothetical protein DAPPUDRAFT_52115"